MINDKANLYVNKLGKLLIVITKNKNSIKYLK